jgi:membrane fusion protein, heavy metal efflux system
MKNKAFYGMTPTEHGIDRPRLMVVTVMAAVALASLTGCSRKVDNNPQTPAVTISNVTLSTAQRQHIHLYTVESSKFHKTIVTNGVVNFDADQATGVLATISGPVSRLLVSLGSRVKKGDPLAAVDSPDFAAAIGAYHKALATAQTNRRLADLDKDLLQHNGVSQREALQAETDATNAEADRDAALEALVSLNVPAETIKDLREGRPLSRAEGMIRAPVTGTVVEKLITPGELLQAGTTPCFTVANLSRVWVMAQIFGSDLASVSVGDSAEVLTGIDSKDFPGRVDNISALVDPDTRSVAVRVVVENPEDFLKIQMYVRVLLTARRESTGILVPVSSILHDDVNLPFVYLAEPDGSFARRHVTLSSRTGDQYDIADGLKAGDQIVVDGGIFVQFIQNQ